MTVFFPEYLNSFSASDAGDEYTVAFTKAATNRVPSSRGPASLSLLPMIMADRYPRPPWQPSTPFSPFGQPNERPRPFETAAPSDTQHGTDDQTPRYIRQPIPVVNSTQLNQPHSGTRSPDQRMVITSLLSEHATHSMASHNDLQRVEQHQHRLPLPRLQTSFERSQTPTNPYTASAPAGYTPQQPSVTLQRLAPILSPGEPRADTVKATRLEDRHSLVPPSMATPASESARATPSSRAGRIMAAPPLKYTLIVRQQPDAARACGFGERDRRAIDPPPIIELQITSTETGQPAADPTALLALHCTLLNAETDQDETDMHVEQPSPAAIPNSNSSSSSSRTRTTSNEPGHKQQQQQQQSKPLTQLPVHRLIGSLVASPYDAKDEHGVRSSFFVFSDLSCRYIGTWRLKFRLLRIDPMGLMPGTLHPCVAEISSKKFGVYTAKTFPGMSASSELLRALRNQGLTVGVRKGSEVRKRSGAGRGTGEGSPADDGSAGAGDRGGRGKKRRRSSEGSGEGSDGDGQGGSSEQDEADDDDDDDDGRDPKSRPRNKARSTASSRSSNRKKGKRSKTAASPASSPGRAASA